MIRENCYSQATQTQDFSESRACTVEPSKISEFEISLLQAEVTRLQLTCEKRLGALEHMKKTVEQLKSALNACKDDRNRLKKQLLELQRLRTNSTGYNSATSLSPSVSPAPAEGHFVSNVNTDQQRKASTPQSYKVAELIRLKHKDSQNRILGSDLSVCGVDSTKVAELLVSQLESESRVQEALVMNSQGSPQRLAVFEAELDRIRCQAAHLRSQLQLLELNLNESRENCESLAVLSAQLEANQTALKLALESAEFALEIQDSLIALANQSNPCEEVIPADLALLLRRIANQLCENPGNCQTEFPMPNQNEFLQSISTVDLFDKAQWSGFLIFHLQRFRAEILFLKNTVVSIPQSTTSSCCFRDVRITGELRNCHEDAHLRILSGEDFRDVRRIQLENALLVQELQFEREEKADVKAQIYLIARDNVDLKLTLEMEQSKSRSYKVQLEHLKQELSRLSPSTQSRESGDSSGLRLKVWELSEALETVSSLAQLRHSQAEEFISDLKQANSALLVACERIRRKCENKLRKSEVQKEKQLRCDKRL